MSCNPPNCLEIPPASWPNPFPPAAEVCGWNFRWYLHFPILLDASGPDATTLANAIADVRGNGGGLYSLNLFFRDAKGACTIEVSILYPSPGNVLRTPQVNCPPGYTWDDLNEQCVLTIIPPVGPPGGGGTGNGHTGGNGGSGGFSCANPNCIVGGLTGPARPGVLSPACIALCAAAGKSDDICDQACCQLCVADPGLESDFKAGFNVAKIITRPKVVQKRSAQAPLLAGFFSSDALFRKVTTGHSRFS